jgi:ubiquinone/menaquinone biosynthesis C-methylase UbiE
MSLKQISKLPSVRNALIRLAIWRAKEKICELIPHLKLTDNILDIGSGNGVLCYELMQQNFNVTPLDVDNLSLLQEAKPIIYNTPRMPFEDSSFDVALLITVLHHTQNPIQVLSEAKRLAKKINRVYFDL